MYLYLQNVLIVDILHMFMGLYFYIIRLYLGPKPFIVTVDPELIRKVTITHFDNFSSRIEVRHPFTIHSEKQFIV